MTCAPPAGFSTRWRACVASDRRPAPSGPWHEGVPGVTMNRAAEQWFGRRTWQPAPWSVPELVEAKRGRSVSVVLPALDEEETVGHVVEAVAAAGPALVDEIVVMDGGSSDATA